MTACSIADRGVAEHVVFRDPAHFPDSMQSATYQTLIFASSWETLATAIKHLRDPSAVLYPASSVGRLQKSPTIACIAGPLLPVESGEAVTVVSAPVHARRPSSSKFCACQRPQSGHSHIRRQHARNAPSCEPSINARHFNYTLPRLQAFAARLATLSRPLPCRSPLRSHARATTQPPRRRPPAIACPCS